MGNFQSLEVVDRGSETQFQVVENVNKQIWGDTGQCFLNSSLATSEMIVNVVCVILLMTIITALVGKGNKKNIKP